MDRTIIHLDMDAFYSSVEQRDRPELRGQPIVVGGDPDSRGVVATASYEARRHGIHSAMPCRAARRLCPSTIFVRPRFDVYREVSRTVMAILRGVSPLVEAVALDEAYVDVSTVVPSEQDAAALGNEVKASIKSQTDLTGSIGIASNKLVAKVASDYHKPDGLTQVRHGEEAGFLAPLSVRRLWGIGPQAERRLVAQGIRTAGELAGREEAWVVGCFGQGGLEWQLLARGIDRSAVTPDAKLRQISRETTFEADLAQPESIREAITRLCTDMSPALSRQRPARTVTLKLRYADFETVTRRLTPGTIISSTALPRHALLLWQEAWNGKPVRLVGVGVSNFIPEQPDQLRLL
ncbi:MAG: DNA polymerase IV [Chloroflexota bacterium]|nr:DNA polymerase IV [Chloroflexota bacterium]